jgi:arginine decarboxylase
MRQSANLSFDLQSQRFVLWEQLAAKVLADPFDSGACRPILDALVLVDAYWAYPGKAVLAQLQMYLDTGAMGLFAQLVTNLSVSLRAGDYRWRRFMPFVTNLSVLDKPILNESKQLHNPWAHVQKKPYFEVLVVHPSMAYESVYRQALVDCTTDMDEFFYDIVFVDTAEAAVAAILANPNIQACVLVWGFEGCRADNSAVVTDYLQFLGDPQAATQLEKNPLLALNYYIRKMRPEMEQVFISELPLYDLDVAFRESFHRVLFHINPFPDLHYHLLNGVRDRFSTPFFHALQAYSHKPKGVFHALPLSQGSSVHGSPWIRDMLDFYGPNIFFAETSSTQGGLDSLLDPKGAIKQSHDKAAKAFGADKTFFVTNGTSTANKIVMQATLVPGDIVLVSSDCHKSIPYGLMLAGAFPVFLETYALNGYDLYGAVWLDRIKEVLYDLKAKGHLHRVKQITLTNSTFDGLLYNVERFMEEILAIKPDIIFHWDEAWFAFGHFNPLYQGRTAMTALRNLKEKYINTPEIKLRVYVTQSTHKSLTSFRQGSMIHISDVLFDEDLFLEAYRMHTSTSPNYQLLASLDIARRQVSLEGFALTKATIHLAINLRNSIRHSDLLSPYFKVLETEDLVPQAQDSKGRSPLESVSILGEAENGYAKHYAGWGTSEFVVDPTRITLEIRQTGMSGSNFRELLINRYNIQVNKISQHTVLFIINIGATSDTTAYLLQVLGEIAARLELEKRSGLIKPAPRVTVLPQRRQFHPLFRPVESDVCELVDLRRAYFLAYDHKAVRYVPLSHALLDEVDAGRELVSASFVTPYPPGFPMVVPGQVITYDILRYLQHLTTKEIHGYYPYKGLKIFDMDYLC